jgi:hypothetical protein
MLANIVCETLHAERRQRIAMPSLRGRTAVASAQNNESRQHRIDQRHIERRLHIVGCRLHQHVGQLLQHDIAMPGEGWPAISKKVCISRSARGTNRDQRVALRVASRRGGNLAQLKLDAGQASKVEGENQLAAMCVSPTQGKEKESARQPCNAISAFTDRFPPRGVTRLWGRACHPF